MPDAVRCQRDAPAVGMVLQFMQQDKVGIAVRNGADHQSGTVKRQFMKQLGIFHITIKRQHPLIMM